MNQEKIDSKVDTLFYLQEELLKKHNGFCKKCNLVHGKPNDKLGIQRWYCDSVFESIERKIKKIKKSIFNDVSKSIVNDLKIQSN